MLQTGQNVCKYFKPMQQHFQRKKSIFIFIEYCWCYHHYPNQKCHPKYISFIVLPNKQDKLGGLKQQKCNLVQFWKLEIWNQGLFLFWRQVEDNLPHASFLASSVCQQSLVFLGFQLPFSHVRLSWRGILLFVPVSLSVHGHPSLDLRPPLLLCKLILSNCICKDI